MFKNKEAAGSPASGHKRNEHGSHYTSEPLDGQALREKLLAAIPAIPTANLKKESAKSWCGACQKCGGIDRFVAKATGKWFCRQCHPEQGSLIDYHMWLDGISFSELCKKYLGDNGKKQADNLSYLSLERKISTTVIDTYVKAGKLFSLNYKGKPAIGAVYTTLEGNTTDSGGVKVQQYIMTDGSGKRFKSGCKPAEPFFFIVGNPEKASEIIVCESVINALTVATIDQGIAAVAIGSTSYIRKVDALKPFKNKIVTVFDNDPAGKQATDKAVNILGGCYTVRWSSDDSTRCDINDLLKNGHVDRILNLIIEATYREPETETPEEKEKLSVWETPLNLVEMAKNPPKPFEWFAKYRIPAGRGILLTGPGGVSKTRVLYHWAIAAITGELWDWEVFKAGKALLVLTEDTEADVHRTLYGLIRSLELSMLEAERVCESLIVYPLAGKDTKLLSHKNGIISKTEDFKKLSDKIRAIGNVVFVGLDPALSLTTGDELDQGHQRALGKMVDDLAVITGATCCLVSHATKASINSDELTSHNSRGGGAITDAVRAEYSMRNMTAKEAARACITDLEERKRHVQLVATKGNHLPPGAFVPIWLKRDDRGTLHKSEIVFSDHLKPTQTDMSAREILSDMSKVSVPLLQAWRYECVKSGVIAAKTEKAQEKAMQRIIKRLMAAGLIKQGLGRGVYLPKETDI